MYLTFLIMISEVAGSFVMLTADRLIIGQRPWDPTRSYCDHCRQQLRWWQLIPIISFILQRGRCQFCHTRIQPFLFVNELAITIAICLLANYQLCHDGLLIVLILTLTFLSTTDFYRQFIYTPSLFPLLTIIPLTHSFWFHFHWQQILIIITTLVFLIILHRGLGGLGGGDIEFIMVILVIMGPWNTAMVVLIASTIMLGWWLLKNDGHNKMPFFPALSIGLLAML